MRTTALITGATSGIGYELSRILAEKGYDLVLVARNEESLNHISEEFRTRHGIRARAIPMDLAGPSAPEELHQRLSAEGIQIDVLVNSAGIAVHGKFSESSAEHQRNLIQLNIAAPTQPCRLFGADMARRGSGRILNVSSTAAFQAGPFLSTYYASKAYLLLFSEALHQEFKKEGVTVTALCPGPTRTEFFRRNDISRTGLDRSPLMMAADRVAEAGFSAMMAGKPLAIPGVMNKLLVFLVRLSPRRVAASVAGFLNR
jgi:short-subunit dehydrogenase